MLLVSPSLLASVVREPRARARVRGIHLSHKVRTGPYAACSNDSAARAVSGRHHLTRWRARVRTARRPPPLGRHVGPYVRLLKLLAFLGVGAC